MMREVLSLYRSILRQGRLQLKLTDQNYFKRLVREEFERNRHQEDSAEIQFQIEVSFKALIFNLCIQDFSESLQQARNFVYVAV